jgi:guanylate kinase
MGKIFCILGKSGSGKDTVFKEIMGCAELGLRGVVTYTTRPRREGETDGIEYHFITDTELEKYKSNGSLIELRQYDTVRGIWSYCTLDDGQINLDTGNYLMIVTLEAYESLSAFFGAESVVPLYLYVEDGLRLTRALQREMTGIKPDYNEMCRRYLADSSDFSAERLGRCGIEKCYDNGDLDKCVEQIIAEILRQIN